MSKEEKKKSIKTGQTICEEAIQRQEEHNCIDVSKKNRYNVKEKCQINNLLKSLTLLFIVIIKKGRLLGFEF